MLLTRFSGCARQCASVRKWEFSFRFRFRFRLGLGLALGLGLGVGLGLGLGISFLNKFLWFSMNSYFFL